MLRLSTVRLSVSVGACLAFIAATPAQAALVTLEGTSVYFIYDTDNVDPSYGTLSVNGNQILALPSGFRAESLGGVGTNTGLPQDRFFATGTIQVLAKSGYQLDNINVREVGSYSMTAGNTAVGVGASLRVFDWNDFVFGPQEFTGLTLSSPLTTKTGTNQPWSAAAGFDLTTSAWNMINHVGLQLDETLTATSYTPGEHAWIEKTAAGGGISISILTSPIPLPAAVWLLGSGLAAFAWVGRRKKKA